MDRLRFQWEIIEAMVGGASAIDLPRLELRSHEEAEGFLATYGFDVRVAKERAELEAIRTTAIGFIESQLLPELPGVAIPEIVRGETAVARLLTAASDPERGLQQRWSCALLRVMHTAAHARMQIQERFGDQVRAQILSRFQPHMTIGEHQVTLGYGEDAIPLHRFEVKHNKPIESVILKLLHKPENVAADIFDHLGLRFVTFERLDVLLVARYLRENHIVSFPNIKPSRSKNTLLDMEWVRGEVQEIQERHYELEPDDRLQLARQRLRDAPYPEAGGHQNPHSVSGYHAIQFTCRQYVRLADPFGGLQLSPAAAAAHGQELSFFFPYEVQILDRHSFDDSRSGLASHDEYKRRQRESVRRRVLGPILA